MLAERKYDPTFYPVIYGLPDGADWKDEQNWYRANPSLGITIPIERVREAFQKALRNPEEENQFKQLRLNLWVSSLTSWISDAVFCKGNAPIDEEALLGRECYGGLDLSSTSDITAFVLVFPPQSEEEPYIVLPYFWLPEETLPLRVARDHVPYDRWEQQGYLQTTEGNVVHYGYIERFIDALGQKFHIKEIAYDRWGAVQMVQNLEGLGFTVIPFGQGFRACRPPARSFISCYWRETSSTAATRFFDGWLETSSPEATLPRISSPTRQNQRKKLMGSLPRLWHSTVPFATQKSRPASMMNGNCLCYKHKYTNKTLCRLAACYLRRLEVI